MEVPLATQGTSATSGGVDASPRIEPLMRFRVLCVLTALCMVAACGGTAGVPSTDPPASTALASDPGVATTAAPGTLSVRPWAAMAVTSLCIEVVEQYTYWFQTDPTGLPPDVPRRPGPEGTVEIEVLVSREPFSPVADALHRALADRHLAVVESGCDASLTVAVEGEPLSARYGLVGTPQAAIHYTGAAVTGTVSLSSTGRPTLSHSLDGRIDPPDSTGYGDSEPSDAPFADVVEEGLCVAFLTWFNTNLFSSTSATCASAAGVGLGLVP